jgi:hypothetical protein
VKHRIDIRFYWNGFKYCTIRASEFVKLYARWVVDFWKKYDAISCENEIK